jgi:DNA-binding NarL/FixJ family response regulator
VAHNFIRVIVIEDDESLLACLAKEINRDPGLKCIGAFPSFEAALPVIELKLPDVILLDLKLPGVCGVAATTVICKNWPRIKVVIFTADLRDEKIYAAFQAGATGFLLKSGPQAELPAGIVKAYGGGCPISPQIEIALVAWFRRRQMLFPHLSPTETIVLGEYDSGTPQKEIASKLNISLHTLRVHANRILDKTGVSSLLRAAYLQRQALN